MRADTTPGAELYESTPQTVTAVRWDGTDRCADVLAVWSGHKTTCGCTAHDGLHLLAGKDGAQEWVPVPVGHWLVRQPGDTSDVWPVDPDYFAAKYRRQRAEAALTPAPLFDGHPCDAARWLADADDLPARITITGGRP